jgi:DNA cross-link repair 1A protein
MCEPSRRYLPGPLSHCPIKVDDFSKGGKSYFLTHAHTDHFHGLRETWNAGRLYCTSITKELLLIKFPCFDAKLIKTLEIGETKLISITKNFSVCVTVLDARHCAGSCMYLFESKHFERGVRVLHTGDFRYEIGQPIPPVLLNSSPSLYNSEIQSPEGEGVQTCVYLDNTYGLKSSPKNPSRLQVQEVLCKILTTKYDSKTRFIFALHGLGKEELVVACARALETKIYVDQERLDSIKCFNEPGWDKLFTTTNVQECRVICIRRGKQVVSNGENDRQTFLKQVREELRAAAASVDATDDPFDLGFSASPSTEEDQDDTNNFVFITPSGWHGLSAFHELQHLSTSNFGRGPRSLRVPYSLHASRDEIIHFIRSCGFQHVIPIVNITADHLAELECGHLQRWEHSRISNTWAQEHQNEPTSRSANRLSDAASSFTTNAQRIIASPESHQRRLELKAKRFRKCVDAETDEDGIEVIFRRDGSLSDATWTKEEDEILLRMHQKRLVWDCIGHERERKKLRRSDYEIFVRLSSIRSLHVDSLNIDI